MSVLAVVRRAIEAGQLFDTGATVVVGVSGGSDSLCLIHVLRELREDLNLSLHIAHLNHCLRGTDSDQDMIFVALLALEWGLPCTLEAIDVKTVARQRHLSLEEAARQVRYDFLCDVAHEVGASVVAVGHNADDQSETVLMHFLRGTGLAGLKGMSPSVNLDSLRVIGNSHSPPHTTKPILLIRPLLSVSRAEIEEYCQAHNLQSRMDQSNLDTTIFRNRLRHQLLPLLETYNPNIRASLQRTAAVAAADYALLTDSLDRAWAQAVIEETETIVVFGLEDWRVLPLALQRATLRQAAYRLRPNLRDVCFVHIEQAVSIAVNGSTGAQATLPRGLRLTVGYHTLRLASGRQIRRWPDWPLLWNDEPVPVTLPGTTSLSGSQQPGRTRVLSGSRENHGNRPEWWLEASTWNGAFDTVVTNPDRWTAYLDADRLGNHPALRRRRPGDCFQPLGMGGCTVQVADFMINAKVPRNAREHIPLLVHKRSGGEGEEIAWLVGWRLDERVKVTTQTRSTIRLRWLCSDDSVSAEA